MISFNNKGVTYIIFSFFFTSIISWFIEIFYSFVLYNHLVFPGTLLGPWCPIYGVSFVLLLLCINKSKSPIYNYIKTFFVVSVVEYIASYISGEIFNNVIWDYSEYIFNINGRICLEMSLMFAALGLFIVYFIEPLIYKLYIKFDKFINFLNFIFTFFFILDIMINIFFV